MDPRHQVNPYIAGSPVTGTEMFYGRQDVFAFVTRNLIGRHRDTPVVLYGQRRTGKTSVLYQLHRHLEDTYRCIFIDLHGLNLSSTGSFLFGVANVISRALRRDYQLSVNLPGRTEFLADPASAFEAMFLDKVWPALGNDHLVLMMDEVVRLDEEVRAGRLEREVFDYLRHLMQHYPRLNFIFSLGSGIEELAKDYAFLFSVALYHRISFLESEAARELITQPAQEHYQLAVEAVERILEITSGHPYYTQLVCHCVFDLWSRSPKEVINAAGVDAVLSEAIELGSANLTYVWEDSTPGEKALMAGLAAAMKGGAGPATAGQARDEWHAVGVSLPEGEAARSLRSLTSREVLAGDEEYSFTVELQRLWLDRHRRLNWVKDELADTVAQWNRLAEPWPADAISVRSGGGAPASDPVVSRSEVRVASGSSEAARPRMGLRSRYILSALVIIVLAVYLAATAAAHVFPFGGDSATTGGTASNPDQNLIQLLVGPLSQETNACQPTSAPRTWKAPGLVQALHCTDSSLKGGETNAYRFDDLADYYAALQSFNRWWKFPSSPVATTCPPSGTIKARKNLSSNDLPAADRQVLECGLLALNSGSSAPMYAYLYPANDALVIVQGAAGSPFSALATWVHHTTLQKNGS
jgi:hypothetical protein